MNARMGAVIAIVAVVIVAAVVALFALRGTDADSGIPDAGTSPSATASPSEAPSPEGSSEAPAATAGSYEEYSESAVAEADGRVLLFFHASWCPQCRAIEDDIRTEGVPAGVTILHVDYDSNQALRQRYGVTLQTTFVEVDSAGDPLQSHVAYDEPSLDAVVAAML